jgi:hypothetical protein
MAALNRVKQKLQEIALNSCARFCSMRPDDSSNLLSEFSQAIMDFSSKRIFRQPVWLMAGLITIAIVCLHGYFLFHAGGFTGDEVSVINLAGSHSIALITGDSFPILMPLLISGWTAMGLAHSDLTLRLLGILIGLGIAGALWLAAWNTRRAPPLFGLALLGLNATVIFWGANLRAYGLGSLLIMLTMSAMCHLLGKPTWPRTLLLSIIAVLSVQTLYQNSIFFASIGLGGWMVCLVRKDKVAAGKILAAALFTVTSLLPYWPSVSKWTHSTAAIRPGFSFVAAADNFRTITSFPLPQYVWVWCLLGVAVIGLGIGALSRRQMQPARREGRMTTTELRVFAGTTLLAALVGYFIFLYYAALITSPWYFLPLLALGAICFDLSLPLVTLPRLFRTATWGILIATVGIAIPFAVRDLNCRFTNVDLVVNRLMKEISPDDYVVVTPWYLGISFNRYYRGAATWDTLPPLADHSTYRFDLIQAEAKNSYASQPVLDRIAKILQSGHQVWIVGAMQVPAPGQRAATEAGRFIAEHSRSFEPVELKIKGLVSDYEQESLLQASGWKTNRPAP